MELKLNFGWSKTAKNNEKVVGETNVLSKKKRAVDNDKSVEFISSIEENTITSSNQQKKEGEIIIPLVQSKYQPLKIKAKLPAVNPQVEVKDELKKEAMEQIIAEAKDLNEKGVEDGFVIPVNEAGGTEEVEEEIPDADYEAVPVVSFGLAALRGMGSKQEIDARLPMAPPPAVRRSKGLGLGAVLEKDVKPKGEDGKELAMKRGTRCCVVKGRLNGRYGTIDAVDGNTDRVIVAMSSAAGGGTVTMPSVTVRLVTEKEFKKYSKYLNREAAEAFKAQEDARMEREREKDRAWRAKEEEKEAYEKKRERKQEKERKEKERRREEKRAAKRPRKEEEKKVPSVWVRPRLRVRLVDKSYCGGKFYKEKLVVMDMPSPTVCVCQTNSRRILDDIHVDMLETVIPRDDRATVMILRGVHKAELAEIVELDPDHFRAIVQLNTEKLLLTYDYDDLCEFVG